MISSILIDPGVEYLQQLLRAETPFAHLLKKLHSSGNDTFSDEFDFDVFDEIFNVT